MSFDTISGKRFDPCLATGLIKYAKTSYPARPVSEEDKCSRRYSWHIPKSRYALTCIRSLEHQTRDTQNCALHEKVDNFMTHTSDARKPDVHLSPLLSPFSPYSCLRPYRPLSQYTNAKGERKPQTLCWGVYHLNPDEVNTRSESLSTYAGPPDPTLTHLQPSDYTFQGDAFFTKRAASRL